MLGWIHSLFISPERWLMGSGSKNSFRFKCCIITKKPAPLKLFCVSGFLQLVPWFTDIVATLDVIVMEMDQFVWVAYRYWLRTDVSLLNR